MATKEDSNSANKIDHVEGMILFDMSNDCLQFYNPNTSDVTEYHYESFKHFHRGFTVIAMDSYIYALLHGKAVYRLDFRHNQSVWEEMQETICDHGPKPCCVASSGSLYAIGSGGRPTKDVEKFDPNANQWSKLKDTPVSISCAALASVDGSIYCVGGWNGKQRMKILYRFTPTTSEWIELEPMKSARTTSTAVAFEHKIFIIGGMRGLDKVADVECYDVISGRWTSMSPMSKAQKSIAAHYFNGWIFGFTRCSSLGDAEKYDITNDRWCKVKFKCNVITSTIYDAVAVQF